MARSRAVPRLAPKLRVIKQVSEHALLTNCTGNVNGPSVGLSLRNDTVTFTLTGTLVGGSVEIGATGPDCHNLFKHVASLSDGERTVTVEGLTAGMLRATVADSLEANVSVVASFEL